MYLWQTCLYICWQFCAPVSQYVWSEGQQCSVLWRWTFFMTAVKTSMVRLLEEPRAGCLRLTNIINYLRLSSHIPALMHTNYRSVSIIIKCIFTISCPQTSSAGKVRRCGVMSWISTQRHVCWWNASNGVSRKTGSCPQTVCKIKQYIVSTDWILMLVFCPISKYLLCSLKGSTMLLFWMPIFKDVFSRTTLFLKHSPKLLVSHSYYVGI